MRHRISLESFLEDVCLDATMKVRGSVITKLSNLIKEGNPKDNSLALVLQKIKGLMKYLCYKELYHIPRIHNVEADVQANRACSLEDTKLEINDSSFFFPIP